MSDPGRDEFTAALTAVRDVEGWMTDAQARRLWDRARILRPPGQVVEIGSFRGRSAIVLARAAPAGVQVVAIDPHAGGDRGPQEIRADEALGRSDHEAFHSNLERAGVAGHVRHVRRMSAEAHGEVRGEIALLYVDGAHRYGPARDDLRDWGARVAGGGTMLIHDGFSSIGVTLATLRLLVASGRFRYRGRVGSLLEYRREPVRGAERVRNAARQLAELPWFARNVLVKASIVTGLRPLARLLGHDSGDWPY